MALRKYTTPKEFAEIYKISLAHAYTVFRRLHHTVPGIVVKIGRNVRADEEALKTWMEAGGDWGQAS